MLPLRYMRDQTSCQVSPVETQIDWVSTGSCPVLPFCSFDLPDLPMLKTTSGTQSICSDSRSMKVDGMDSMVHWKRSFLLRTKGFPLPSWGVSSVSRCTPLHVGHVSASS